MILYMRKIFFIAVFFSLIQYLNAQTIGEIALYKAYFFEEGQDLSKPLSEIKYSTIKKGKEVEIISVDTTDAFHCIVKYKGKRGIIHNSALKDRFVLIPFYSNIRKEYAEYIKTGVPYYGMNETETGLLVGINPEIEKSSINPNIVKWRFPATYGKLDNFCFYKGKLCKAEVNGRTVIGYHTIFSFGLSNVEVDGKSFSIEPSIKTFQDSDIKIDWTILDSSFEFTLQNLSESSIKILWDNMSFVDIFKESNKVINGETIKAHIGMSQPASIVPKGTKFSAVGVPYPKRRFILNRYLCPEELADSQQNERKYEIGILLPIEKEGNIKEYLFTFKVDDIIVKQVKPSIM